MRALAARKRPAPIRVSSQAPEPECAEGGAPARCYRSHRSARPDPRVQVRFHAGRHGRGPASGGYPSNGSDSESPTA